MTIDTFSPAGNEVTIRFSNPVAARHFLDWLCGSGEQDYWAWMECRENEESRADMTAVEFNYHDPGRGVVIATCGRLDNEG